MKVALLCSGLGRIHRGHEVFARDLFTLLGGSVDITLFKGGGQPAPGEIVVPNLHRQSPLLKDIHVAASPKWAEAVREQERIRIEGETFAHAALMPLLEGGYDIVHCLEQEVCNVVYDNRHLFARPPKLLFSNGGAIPAADLPRCDFVQEHTPHNLAHSVRGRSIMIPHGVDLQRFHPMPRGDFRARHGIAEDAFVVISVGTICFWHKRMDHVIREVAAVPDAHLLMVGQEHPDTPAIRELAQQMLGPRATLLSLPHEQLPQAYAAADVFVLGSLFETFGIVYIEALAMGLPVVCTNHPNQRGIVQQAVFVDMKKPGAVSAALQPERRAALAELGRAGPAIAARDYDLTVLRQRYLEAYASMAGAPSSLPTWSRQRQIQSNIKNAMKKSMRLLRGQAE